ncbi:MAG: hypothetical protein ABI779_00700 [Acidobacteriota bacterium]
MVWLIGLGLALFLYSALILRPGNLGFRKSLARNPETAYMHFNNDPAWTILEADSVDGRELAQREEWDGPFRLWIPAPGKEIILFGRVGEYERSHRAFLEQLRKPFDDPDGRARPGEGMRLNLAIVVSGITLIVALMLRWPPFWWVPVTVLIAGFVDLWTRSWVMSPRLGSARNLSMALKSFCALFGLYAMVGMLACVALIVWWLVASPGG